MKIIVDTDLIKSYVEDNHVKDVVCDGESLGSLLIDDETIWYPCYKGHTEAIDEAVAPTCTEPGLTEGSHCSICGATVVAQEFVPATGHKYSSILQAATCTEQGLETYTCVYCGDSYEVTFDALGHDYGEWTITLDPTCLLAGSKRRDCRRSICDYYETETIPALGHDPVPILNIPPTCTETGLTEGKKCFRCGTVLEVQRPIPALGHTPSDTWTTTKPATFDSAGTRVKYCTVCGDIAETATIPKLNVLKFVENSDGTLSVMATAKGISSNTDLEGTIFIPSEHEGKQVTGIAMFGFDECPSIKTIVIPDSVTEISNYAFRNCTSLTRVVIPNSVTTIGGNAFENCSKLTDIVIPNSVTYIGDRAFKDCNSLESITLPFIGESRKTASDTYQYPLGYLFGNNKTIYTYEVEQSYYGAKSNYGSLTTTESTYCIPYTLKNITVTGGEILRGAFENCEYLETVDIKYGATKIGRYAFYNCHKLTSIIIPDSVTEIGDSAFAYCYDLNDVVIPDSVTSIDSWAFCECTSFLRVTIPDSVTSIGYSAFYDCRGLMEVSFGTQSQLTSIGNWAFKGCVTLRDISFGDNSQLTSIGEEAFDGCNNIYNLVLPDSVEFIGARAFNSYRSVVSYYGQSVNNSLTIPNGVCWKFSYDGTGDDDGTIPEPVYIDADAYNNNDIITLFSETYADYEWTPIEHVYGDWHVINEPTCITVGLKGKDCVNCGHRETEMIPTSGEHTYKSVVTAPTCTEQGYTTHTCTVCGRMYIDSHVPALGHSYLPIVTLPTCTTKGYTTYTCTMCGDSYIDNFVPGTGHNWKDATCTDPKTCRTCGATEGSALGHIEVIDPAVAATCTTAGKTEGKHCSRCNAVLVAQSTVPRLGHLYERVVKAPTCTEQGYDSYTCSRCGDSYKDNFTAATGHTWKAATCTTPKTCSVCGATEGSASGHKWSAWSIVSSPTCTKAGSNRRTCSVCDAFETQMVAATGHNWKAATCTKPKTCSVCGATEGSALGHTKVSYPVVHPTYTTVGYRGGSYCSVCGTVLETRRTILKTPAITDAILSSGGTGVDLWIKNNNSLPVTCYVSLYDDDGTNLADDSFTIAANTNVNVSLLYSSSAVLPLECSVYFEASGYENSYEEVVILG